MIRYKHWCPTGCGKKVIHWNQTIGFKCEECGSKFKSLSDLNKQWDIKPETKGDKR